MNANDLRLYEELNHRISILGFYIVLVGSSFELKEQSSDLSLGCFPDLDRLAYYWHGFEVGYSKGKNIRCK